MTRTLDESRDYIVAHIDRTLTFLGFSPNDVELILAWNDPACATVNWSAQTSIGDMIGDFPVPIHAALDGYDCRCYVAETAVARLREWEARQHDPAGAIRLPSV